MEIKSQNQLKKERQMARSQIAKKMKLEKNKEVRKTENLSDNFRNTVFNSPQTSRQPATPPKRNIFQRVSWWWGGKSRKQRILIIGASLLFLFSLGLFIVYSWWTGLDGKLIKSSLSGTVTAEGTEDPIEGVKIIIDNEFKGETDESGNYHTKGLENGKVRIRLEKNGFETIETNIVIERYTTLRDFTMNSLPKGRLIGKLILDRNYDLSLIKIQLGDTTTQVEPNGVFTTEEVYRGLYTLSISSPQFVDIVKEDYEILAGVNEMETMVLTPAADIIGKVIDWVTEKQITDFTLVSLEKTISITDQSFVIKDYTNLDKLEKFVFRKEGYREVSEERRLQMGENDLGEIFLYRDQRAVYKDVATNTLYSITLDRIDRSRITSTGVNVLSYSQPNSSNEIYFELGGSEAGIYKTSVEGIGTSLVCSSRNAVRTYINYHARKFVEVTRNEEAYIATYRSFDQGEAAVELFQTTVEPSSFIISDNGAIVYYQLSEAAKEGVYRYIHEHGTTRKIMSDSAISLLATDSTGTNLLYSRASEIRRFNANTSREFEIGFGSPTYTLYLEGYVIYLFNDDLFIKTETGQNIDNITISGAMRNLDYGNNSLIYYQDTVGLKVLSVEEPLADKVIF